MEGLFQGKSEQQYDQTTVAGATWADIDPDAIATYRRLRSKANPNASELTWEDSDLLLALGAVVSEGAKIVPTMAGIVSFGSQIALRRLFPSFRVDYIRIPGKQWVETPDGRFDTLDMRGPMVTLIGRAISAILDDLPKSLMIPASSTGTRGEFPSIPERVVREAVVNSLMHRSYRRNEPVQIIRYANRIEIKNPGYSLKHEERFDDPGSNHRNPHIAAILHETLFAETKGSGIRVMRNLMEQNGLAPPSFESDRVTDNFTARFLFHHFLGESDMKWLSLLKPHELNEAQTKALIHVRELGAVDNSTYRNLNRVDTLVASKHLKELHTLGLLTIKRGRQLDLLRPR